MLEYFLPLLTLCMIQSGTPGPNNIMLTASGKNFGFIKTIPHMLGVVLGYLTLLTVLSLGLITIFDQYPIVQEILKYIGACYLLYLAYRIYSSDNKSDSSKSRPLTFIEVTLFQYVNPKGIMMGITTISIYTDFYQYEFIDSYIEGMMFIFLSYTIVNTIAVVGWTAVGVSLDNFIKSSKAIKRFNTIMAILLVLTIGLIFSDFS
ncbi:MAG: hypothetical protein CMC31_01455 [Flavobacteriaceae bacterium]|nr:hypothetical protein [Flavobacteriaceae bacterium]|tara:strand:+ start:68 stop:682 length:615 start_codon:yes stop_codon:yes gene_type:complete